MRALLLLAAFAALVACDEDAALPRAEDPESTFSFALLEEAAETAQDRRVAWRMPDGLTVTAQRMPTSDSTVRERTVDMVARHRHTLRSRRGRRDHEPDGLRSRGVAHVLHGRLDGDAGGR